MGWFDSLFSGLFDSAPSSAADAAMGGTTDIGSSGLGALADGSSGWFDGLPSDLISAGIGGANPSTFGGGWGGDSSTAYFDPNSVGPPPGGATLGSVMPEQGSSLVGSSLGPGGSDGPDPESFLREGTMNPSESAGGSVGATRLAPPPPTAWESLKQAPGKWWQGAQEVPGKMASSFNRDPFGNSLKIAGMAAPFAMAGIQSAMQPGAPKPARSPAQFTPTDEPIPVPSAMSPLAGQGPQGGFRVRSNVGMRNR